MLVVINAVSDLIADKNIESRIRDLLLNKYIVPGIRDVMRASAAERQIGIDLIVVLRNGQRIYLQLRPNYTLASWAKRFTTANVAIIVANEKTPDGLLAKKLMEGLEYFRCN